MKKVLLINYFYSDYTGSELLTKQLAEYFYERNYKVYIGSFFQGFSLLKDTRKIATYVNLLRIKNINEEFDLVWAQHSTILTYCIFNLELQYKKIILSILSPYESMESLPSYYKHIDLIVANSNETKEKLILETDKKIKNVHVLLNSVPKEFFKESNNSSILKKIAIVSNHIPEELRETKKLFEQKNIEMDFIGKEDNYKIVTPELLEQYNLIITIGKTVQYCFALGIPVYIYDHFGGPGYLTRENYKYEELKNYSGRSTREKKGTFEIVRDIIEKYSRNLDDLIFFKNLAKERYSLEKNLNFIISKVEKIKEKKFLRKKNLDIIKKEYLFEKRNNENYMKLLSQIIDSNFENQLEIKYLIDEKEYSFNKRIDIRNKVEMRMNFKDSGNFNFMRLDLVDNLKCTIEILKFTYTDFNGKKIDFMQELTGNFIKKENNFYLFDVKDPQFYLEKKLKVKENNILEISYNVY
jgi:glycosyltransferase, family 2